MDYFVPYLLDSPVKVWVWKIMCLWILAVCGQKKDILASTAIWCAPNTPWDWLCNPLQYVDLSLWPDPSPHFIDLTVVFMQKQKQTKKNTLHFRCSLRFGFLFSNPFIVCSIVNSWDLKLCPVNLNVFAFKEWVTTVARSRQCLRKVGDHRRGSYVVNKEADWQPFINSAVCFLP